MKKIRILTIFLILSLFLSIYFLTQLIKWNIDRQNLEKEMQEIKNITTLQEIKSEEYLMLDENSAYGKEEFLSVDFSSLKQENDEVVGWIRIPNTKIDYPFVKHDNNQFYLSHSFDKSYNQAGWIFLDYRNSIENLDQNTILYAHGRVDKTMFGSLKDTLEQSWLDNPSNYVVKISTPTYNYIFEIFSLYHIKTTNDYLSTTFSSETQYLSFLNQIKARSVFSFPTTVASKDKIITLSTCYSTSEKMVLHAKLIKQEQND